MSINLGKTNDIFEKCFCLKDFKIKYLYFDPKYLLCLLLEKQLLSVDKSVQRNGNRRNEKFKDNWACSTLELLAKFGCDRCCVNGKFL